MQEARLALDLHHKIVAVSPAVEALPGYTELSARLEGGRCGPGRVLQ